MKIRACKNVNIRYREDYSNNGIWTDVQMVNIEKDDLPKILHIEVFEKVDNAYLVAMAGLSSTTPPPKKIVLMYEMRIDNYHFTFEDQKLAEAYFDYFLGHMEKSFKDTYPEFAL